MNTRVIAASAFAFLLGSASVATRSSSAAVIYSYVTGQSNYIATPGQVLTVPIYLQESLSAGSASIIAANGGLLGGGFSVSDPTIVQNGSTLTSLAGYAANFPGGGFGASPSDSATFLAGDNTTSLNATSGPTPDANGLIELGVLSLTAGAAGTSTNFLLANYAYPSAADGYTDTFEPAATGGYNLDATSTSPAFIGASTDPTTFTITVPGITPVTPEPAACAIGLVGAGMMILNRQKKRIAK